MGFDAMNSRRRVSTLLDGQDRLDAGIFVVDQCQRSLSLRLQLAELDMDVKFYGTQEDMDEELHEAEQAQNPGMAMT